MRASTTQNILYDYRYISLNEDVKCNLNHAIHMRRDYMKMEDEEQFTIAERVMILGGIVGAMGCLYLILSIIA